MKLKKLTLTGLWWIWGILLFVLLIPISQNPVLFDDPRPAWDWFLPNILPTMTLVGAGAYAGRHARAPRRSGIDFLFYLTLIMSTVYLAVLAHAILKTQTSTTPLAMLQTSNIWLGPMQALATSLLGLFFIKPDEGGKDTAASAAAEGAEEGQE